MFWAITIIVTVKYVMLIMGADNDSEGGIMALTALLLRFRGPTTPSRRTVVALGTKTRNWTAALLAFKIAFGDRVPDAS